MNNIKFLTSILGYCFLVVLLMYLGNFVIGFLASFVYYIVLLGLSLGAVFYFRGKLYRKP